VDFGDLIYRVVRLFEGHPEVARDEGAKYPHVVVDEYQDVNRASARLLQLLRPRRRRALGRGRRAPGDLPVPGGVAAQLP
jgi:superfamily I DNA/RNA helicase